MRGKPKADLARRLRGEMDAPERPAGARGETSDPAGGSMGDDVWLKLLKSLTKMTKETQYVYTSDFWFYFLLKSNIIIKNVQHTPTE